MNAGHFRKNTVSTGDLNRGRRTESRVLFGYFLHDAKSDNPFPLPGTPRFCKPRISTQNYKSALTKLNSSAASRLLPAASPPKTFPAGNVSILFVRHKKYAKKAILPPAAAISRRQRRLAVLFANRKAPYQKYLTR